MNATVVAVSGRAGAAFLDVGVGRRLGRKRGGGTTRVLGMLRFDDVMQRLIEDEIHEDDGMSSSEITEEEAGVIEAALLDAPAKVGRYRRDRRWSERRVVIRIKDDDNEDDEGKDYDATVACVLCLISALSLLPQVCSVELEQDVSALNIELQWIDQGGSTVLNLFVPDLFLFWIFSAKYSTELHNIFSIFEKVQKIQYLTQRHAAKIKYVHTYEV